jgi:hypothetical protein
LPKVKKLLENISKNSVFDGKEFEEFFNKIEKKI